MEQIAAAEKAMTCSCVNHSSKVNMQKVSKTAYAKHNPKKNEIPESAANVKSQQLRIPESAETFNEFSRNYSRGSLLQESAESCENLR